MKILSFFLCFLTISTYLPASQEKEVAKEVETGKSEEAKAEGKKDTTGKKEVEASKDEKEEVIIITSIKSGAIGLKYPGTDKFVEGKVNDKITKGTWIITDEDTDIMLTFYPDKNNLEEDNSTLQIGSNSKIKITDFEASAERVKTKLDLRAGSITSNVKRRKSVKNDFKVRTRQITAAVRGTEHSYSTDSESTIAAVTTGEVKLLMRGTDHQQAADAEAAEQAKDDPKGETKDRPKDGSKDSSKVRPPVGSPEMIGPSSTDLMMGIKAGEQTDNLGTPSVDMKLMVSQAPSVFYGSSEGENKLQVVNGTMAISNPLDAQFTSKLTNAEIEAVKTSAEDSYVNFEEVEAKMVWLWDAQRDEHIAYDRRQFKLVGPDEHCEENHWHAYNDSHIVSMDGSKVLNQINTTGQCAFGKKDQLKFVPHGTNPPPPLSSN